MKYPTVVLAGTRESGFPRLESLVLRSMSEGILPTPVLFQVLGKSGVGDAADRSTDLNQAIRRVAVLSSDTLAAALSSAKVVITHGGPGAILAANRSGHRPIAIARRRRFGEHVDDHQVAFVAWAVRKGLAHAVEAVPELSALLADLVSGTVARDVASLAAEGSDAAQRFESAIERLLARRGVGSGRMASGTR